MIKIKNKLDINKTELILHNTKYNYPSSNLKISKSFLKQFELKDVNFSSDEFEELILQDIMRNDNDIRVKLSRDMTNTLNTWIKNKIKKKENIAINTIGTTRGGKSLINLKLADNINRMYKTPFDTPYLVCANQKEYKTKLMGAKFGTCFQIDENAFTNVGEGSMTETQQLKDIQNIIAKQNIHSLYITPKTFLQNNATLGISIWKKDTRNWLSQCLLYSLKNSNPILMGYVIINLGTLFSDYGCYMYKLFGGCTNPNRLDLIDINKKKNILEFIDKRDINNHLKVTKSLDFLKYTSCIDIKYKNNIKDLKKTYTADDKDKIPCPFYRVCYNPLCQYELKKDNWILREMKGGMDERATERFRVALELLKKIGFYDVEKNRFMLKASGKQNLKIKMELYLPKISNSKFTGTEKETILAIIQSSGEIEVFEEICNNLEYDKYEILNDIEGTKPLIKMFKEIEKTNKKKVSS